MKGYKPTFEFVCWSKQVFVDIHAFILLHKDMSHIEHSSLSFFIISNSSLLQPNKTLIWNSSVT